MIYDPSSSCSSTRTASACCPAQVVNSSELTAYIQESLCLISLNHIYLLKAIIFLWTYQIKCISDNLGRMDRGMDKAGIFDCALIVTACRRSVSLELTHQIYAAIFRKFVSQKENSVHYWLPPMFTINRSP